MAIKNAYVAPYAAAVKAKVKVPVFVAGRINQPQIAEQVLAAGQADMIGMTRAMIADMASEAGCSGDIVLRLKADGSPFLTDSGNVIVDCKFGKIPDPEALDAVLKEIPGVVENGLFLGIAELAIIARPSGIVTIEAPEDVS